MCEHTSTKRNRYGDIICVDCSAICEICIRCNNTFEKKEKHQEFCESCDEIVLAEEDDDEDYVDDENEENSFPNIPIYSNSNRFCCPESNNLNQNPLLIILRSAENAKKKIKYSFSPPPSDFYKTVSLQSNSESVEPTIEEVEIISICQHDKQNNLFLVERKDGYVSWEELETIKNTLIYKEWNKK
jgi:hypothetical protein